MKNIIYILLFMSVKYLNAQHIIPKIIEKEALVALSYYPQLKNTEIEFRFKDNIKKSTMLAQPVFGSLLKSKKKRRYLILMSKKFKISGKEFKTTDVDSDILVGWLGHELGHILDYQNRSSLNLLWFGIKYSLSDNYIKEAERAADSYAVASGMGDYILKTKNFILNNAEIDATYKARIIKYYLSPAEIMLLVKEQEKKEQ
ncbi:MULTISPECIES: hypothetical protein [Cellulophaga]|uniref:Uncharacterized protein n=2 Tax=Cellulophaga TaxID=104264 RepID=F0RI03_CELLC|nr:MULTISPECIES: hypothetical protein [Cellulophaga]ADY30284.1 hypothetical protein Celly_2467 [Cellulophaga lytica DSM 7489]AIM61274.1 hypothetical protein IX49_12375 [Cellulophaga lytica]APU11179.1 hypothetical protein A5M85_13090 [Cellulophaga lytica]WQG78782.1 hypothetical protein SR888_07550 [Cellulophaga lytica]SNQ43018.1 Conserved hypothetical protein [Cellulophaga lytica]